MKLTYYKTDQMAADIFTKAFNSVDKWHDVCCLIGHIDPKAGLGQPSAGKKKGPVALASSMAPGNGMPNAVPIIQKE